MKILYTLERKIGKYIPENITKYLLVGQIISYVLVYARPEYEKHFLLTGKQLFQGELWRFFTIFFAPASESVLFVIFVWYFFYLFGTALELQWGSFRYLTYIAIAYIFVILFSLVFPDISVSSVAIYTSLFLAFAYLNPNYTLLLFFIIPVKMKWLEYLAWFGILLTVLSGSLPTKILTLLAVSNFFIFFHRELRLTLGSIFNKASSQPKKTLQTKLPLHVCAVCGRNNRDNPDMEIRYCSTCYPATCYCGEHSQNHQHKKAVN